MTTAYVALGSNLGDRRGFIDAALDRLDRGGAPVRARSAYYETDPVTPDPQPLFLNAAVRVDTTLSAAALLDLCLEIESALGRSRPAGRPMAPREIDLDLLLYGDAIIDQPPGLVIPHPRLLERPFVRIPLAEIATPELVHPISRDRLDRAAPAPSVRRVSDAS
jgi:2-amino-4-hydroxy-6-hydroxymethyldihydropteridine diphosphokinase